VFDKANANLWESTIGTTSPVDAFAAGDSPCGARQLIGNVWEWTSTDFAAYDQGQDIEADAPLKSLRGGAFDTYFPHQASWRFQSGELLLGRRHNVGFRCALCACDIASCPDEALVS
jgi:iron(II)-dependent oxidoreductase